MKSNKSMMQLAIVKAKIKGPRTLDYGGKPKTAIYITMDEINELHDEEGFTSERTVERRVNKWLVMGKNEWYCQVGKTFVLQIWDRDLITAMENHQNRNLTTECLGVIPFHSASQMAASE